tara:strand:+ start:371 stop:538 length:168 start_codon:yes stop_codon:yes gene_type:complete
MTMKSERVFLIVMAIMIVVLLSSCALLDKLRGNPNPHSEILIEVPVVDNVEDIRG